MVQNKAPKLLVGVSQCLLGDNVRYDGASKPNDIILQQLSEQFELVPVCPEVEAGLSIPRPPVQLTGSVDNPELIGRDDASVNITSIMQNYCKSKPAELENLHGYIFKSRSPSCGLNSTPVFINGKCVTEHSRGMFARAMCEAYPALPMIEDTKLECSLENFIEAVLDYANR